MIIDNQVCTLKQAKRLKELGVMQNSLFYWHPSHEIPVSGDTWVTKSGGRYKKLLARYDKRGSASAFTVAELGEMLPPGYDTMRVTEANGLQWKGYDLDGKDYPEETGFRTEAECRAAMVISLLDTGEVTVNEINNRITEQS